MSAFIWVYVKNETFIVGKNYYRSQKYTWLTKEGG